MYMYMSMYMYIYVHVHVHMHVHAHVCVCVCVLYVSCVCVCICVCVHVCVCVYVQRIPRLGKAVLLGQELVIANLRKIIFTVSSPRLRRGTCTLPKPVCPEYRDQPEASPTLPNASRTDGNPDPEERVLVVDSIADLQLPKLQVP